MRHLSIIKTVLALICTCVSFFGHTQSELEATKNAILQKIIASEGNTDLIHSDSNTIVWCQTDTFKFVRYTSAIRDVHRYDTLEISLHFESGWSDSALIKTKKNNTRLIEKHKVKFIHYMDSINWRGYKISRSWFESHPVLFLKMNYPVVFNDKELAEIELIRRCPDFIVESVGVFLDCSHTGIDPPEIEREFVEKLRFISEDIFETQGIVYGDKMYE